MASFVWFTKAAVNCGYALARLIVTTVVTVEDSPEGVVVDLELQPIVGARSVSEVPRIDRVRPLYQL